MDSTIALTYRRVSTYHQERDGVSLDVQTDQCLDYIRRQPGWRLGGDFQDTLTGRTAKRKDYQQLLEEARQLRATGERVVIVSAALDRMGRDLEESVRARKELRTLDVPLHCIREGGVMSDLQANIYASIAQDEADRIRARVKGSRKHNRERGYRSTSRAPWGFIWGASTDLEREAGAPPSILRPDPATADYVREAWARVAAGESARQVGRWVAGLTSDARGGRAFGFGNVLAMLKNPTYIGRVFEPGRARKTPDLEALALPSGRWQPLIDDDTWTVVQHQIARHQRMPKQAKGEYLLVGLLRCPRCGLRMQGRAHTSGKLYGCTVPGKGCYFGGRADLIDRATLDKLEALLAPLTGDADILRAMKAEWQRLQKPADRPSVGRIRTLERVIAKAQRRQQEVLALLADRVIDREKYRAFDDREQADIDAARRELAELQSVEAPSVLPSFDDVVRAAGNWLATIRDAGIQERRDVLAVFVQTVTPQRIGTGRYTVDVKWSDIGDALASLPVPQPAEPDPVADPAATGAPGALSAPEDATRTAGLRPAIRTLLADGEWHPDDAVYQHVAGLVPARSASRIYVRYRRAKTDDDRVRVAVGREILVRRALTQIGAERRGSGPDMAWRLSQNVA